MQTRIPASLFALVVLSMTTIVTPAPAGAACLTRPSGLTHWWPGDGSTVDVHGGLPATLQGDAGYGAGQVSQAFQLDGSGDSVHVDSDPAIQVGSADFTVDLWVYFNSTSGEQVLIEKWIDGVSGWTLTKLAGNQIQLAMAGSGSPTSAPQSIPTSTWIHFAARREGGNVAVFMNGTSIVTGSASSNLDSTESLKFGRRGDGRGFFLNGRVDEVHLFVGRALSDTEIQDIHASASEGICRTAVCGDGMRELAEACDDGNMTSGDGCENDCTLSCGNNATTGSEECDDGNLVDEDGCDSNCRNTGCPNGVRTGMEVCDDGNMADTDACKNDCTPAFCGDGVVEAGVELCDDANADELDGCESDCTPGDACVAPLAGLLGWWPGEDSVGDIAGGHNAVLENGAGYAAGKVGRAFTLGGDDEFIGVPSSPSLNVDTGEFTVDLWVNFEDTEGEQVLVEKYVEKFNPEASSGWTLTKLDRDTVRFVATTEGVDTPRLTLAPHTWLHFAARRSAAGLAIFVNGVRVGFETDTPMSNLSSSSSLKFGHRGGPADTPGSTDTRGFHLHGQIDEVHLFGRALADAEILALHGAGRAGLCVPTPACGNGFTEAGEACDDGNAVANDGCENDCTSSCGNGVTSAPEECDDANATEGDGCDSNCTVSVCGNDVAAGSEVCDDGNLVDGDGCDANCTPTACGNGVRTGDTGEDCDDGNVDDGDGCESDCVPTSVEEIAAPGETITTDPLALGATPQLPIQTALTTPDGGVVSIATSNEPLSEATVLALVRTLLIEAPPATAAEPLIIVLTVDATAIPPGVDLLRIDLARDGEILEPCSGTLGTASPNPCIQSRILLLDGDVQITALTSHASLWDVVVRGLFKDEQKCVTGANKAGARVAAAQGKLSAGCLKDANAGKESDPQACALTDADGDVDSASQKTIEFAAKSCVVAPPFGFTDAATINAAATQARLDLDADMFGSDLNAAVTSDKDAATCQSAIVKSVDKLFATKTKLLLGCVADGLDGEPRVMVSAPDLAACYETLDADADSKAAKSSGKLAGALVDRCDGTTLADVLPGACASSMDVSYCLETAIDCRLCRMFNAMDDVVTDCDEFDDGTVNGSCD